MTRRFRPGWSARRAVVVGLALGVAGSVLPGLMLQWMTVSVLGRDLVAVAAADEISPPAGATDVAPDGVDQAVRQEGSATGVEPFTLIGVSMDRPSSAPVFLRTEHDGQWTDWYEMSFEDSDGPDRNSAEGKANRVTTDGVWVGPSTGYEINVADGSGAVTALLVRDEQKPVVAQAPTATAGAETVEPPFAYNNRASWGAQPPVNAPSYGSELKLGVVHHSDTATSYQPADVPAILRSIQAFHQQGRGWNDIAYNVVVDRFGTIWEARGGGIDQPVIGSHALGFNTNTVGVMMLGTYETDVAPVAMVESVGRVMGWKMFMSGGDPAGSTQFTSGGSLTIPAGAVVTLPRIAGHRDVGATACPGNNGYVQIGAIRTRAKAYYDELVANSTPFGFVDSSVGGPGTVTVSGWVIDPDAFGGTGQVRVSLADRSITVTAAASRPDVDAAFARGPLHGFTAQMTGVPAGGRSACVTWLNPGPGPDVNVGCAGVTVSPPVAGGPPVGQITSATPTVGGLSVSGFALDADQPAGISVVVSAGSQTVTVPANQPVSGLGGIYAAQGDNHGFSASFSGMYGGATQVCATAVNAGGGADVALGCTSVTLPGGSPIGYLDVVRRDGQTITATGWVVDPDSPASLWTVLQIDGASAVGVTADDDRPDIAAAFPGQGAAHGFTLSFTMGLAPGAHSVCASSDGVGQGPGRVFSCGTVIVPGVTATPKGGMDGVSVGRRRVTLSGWAFDTSTSGRVLVWLVLDGQWKFAWAEQYKPFFGLFFPGVGENHGYSITVPVRRGRHRVCGASFTADLKALTFLGCQSFRVR